MDKQMLAQKALYFNDLGNRTKPGSEQTVMFLKSMMYAAAATGHYIGAANEGGKRDFPD